MCGIAGVFYFDPRTTVDVERVVAMRDAVTHRGPDGSGTRLGPGYGLGHRRLSIVDLEGGVQPMADPAERVWVTFNGEIYNHEALRRELSAGGVQFRTASDTEVLVHGWRAWGPQLVQRLHGMFSFALVDEERQELFCARDRLGKKPFHYRLVPGAADQVAGLTFGSEIKSLLADPSTPRTLSPQAVQQYLCLRYVPDPNTVFAAVHKLPPGHTLHAANGRVTIEPYWQLSFAQASRASFDELAAEVLTTFDEVVAARLMSDVPLGAFLSGGVDSMAVVESMTRSSTEPVVACTMGFEDPAHDEREGARAAAAAVGATLHEGVVGAKDLLDQQWFDDTFDEPFADSSAIPTYHVSRLARQHVTVALSGDGGDESFAGYRRYPFDWRENRYRRLLPAMAWNVLGAVYPKGDFLPRVLRAKRTFQNLGTDPAVAYARSVSANLPGEILPLLHGEFAQAIGDPLQPVIDAYRRADGPDALARAAYADFQTNLPGDILTKVDRASMAVSLEVRAPLLDHRMVELAARIPSAMKLQGHQTKGFLRRVLKDRLDAKALARRKQGFTVPLRSWMAGDLGDALERALDDGPLGDVFRVDAVREHLAAHRRGLADRGELLWSMLCFERFLRRWGA